MVYVILFCSWKDGASSALRAEPCGAEAAVRKVSLALRAPVGRAAPGTRPRAQPRTLQISGEQSTGNSGLPNFPDWASHPTRILGAHPFLSLVAPGHTSGPLSAPWFGDSLRKTERKPSWDASV